MVRRGDLERYDWEAGEPAVREAVTELREYLALEIARRRNDRGADLISALVAAHDDAEALSSNELLAFAVLLLVAGNETTTNLIGNGLAVPKPTHVAPPLLRRKMKLLIKPAMLDAVVSFLWNYLF